MSRVGAGIGQRAYAKGSRLIEEVLPEEGLIEVASRLRSKRLGHGASLGFRRRDSSTSPGQDRVIARAEGMTGPQLRAKTSF
jgi:hypothetical protein